MPNYHYPAGCTANDFDIPNEIDDAAPIRLRTTQGKVISIMPDGRVIEGGACVAMLPELYDAVVSIEEAA